MKELLKRILKIDERREAKRLAELDEHLDRGLPQIFKPIGSFLVNGKCDEDAGRVANLVESLRSEIASHGEQEVDILFSPKPGSAGATVDESLRPEHGKVLKFTMRRVAETGKDRRWGVVLYLLVREASSKVILELGSCAGLSAAYMGSSRDVVELTTIEGSPALSELAKQTCGKVNKNIKVINGLFNDVLDVYLTPNQKIDLAYIDGHHEKIATLLYMNRILPNMVPGGWVVFDDICWSHDMNQAWEEICGCEAFDLAVDLGMIGVCRVKGKGGVVADRKIFDLRGVVGHGFIQDPKEWNE